MMTEEQLAAMIDHTLLKAPATDAEIAALCDEAARLGTASICVDPTHVALAKDCLEGTSVKICTVIGFPLGAATTAVKAFVAREAASSGADELDMVMDIGAVKAAGGIRTLADAKKNIEAGASRLGTSATVAILEAL